MSAQPSLDELQSALQEKLALLKDLHRQLAIASDVGRRFQYQMQIAQCQAEIQTLADRIDSFYPPGSSAANAGAANAGAADPDLAESAT